MLALWPWLTGCVASRQLLEGLAIWPFLLSAQPRSDDVAPLAAFEAVVCVVQTSRIEALSHAPVEGAAVRVVDPAGRSVSLDPAEPGLYTGGDLGAAGLAWAPGELVRVEVDVEGATAWVEGPATAPLDWQLSVVEQPVGEALTVELPAGYEADFDQVLARVQDLDGAVTWTRYPDGVDAWLDFALTDETPPALGVAGTAFPEADELLGVQVLGLTGARDTATRSEELTSVLNGFTTGSGFVVGVLTSTEDR